MFFDKNQFFITQKMTIKYFMDFLSLSHGQIQSKLWLCEELEPHIPENATIAILGSWYNILGFILATRNPKKYASIAGIDSDPEVQEIADKFCEAFMIHPTAFIRNIHADANLFDLNGYDVIINCSVEHMRNNFWLNHLTKGQIVCIQSSNVDIQNDNVWKINNPVKTFDDFKKKYPLETILYQDEKLIQYNDWGYSRYMTIGIK